LQRGDTLVITRIDRLARSMRDLQDIVYELRDKGATLKATEQPIDIFQSRGLQRLDLWLPELELGVSRKLRRPYAAPDAYGRQQLVSS